jgi:hypothetical protein
MAFTTSKPDRVEVGNKIILVEAKLCWYQVTVLGQYYPYTKYLGIKTCN